jgi:hypothetical protein
MTQTVLIGHLNYRLQDDGTAVVAENRALTLPEVHIPTTVAHDSKTYRVVSVGQNAFHMNRHITSVTFAPNSHVASFDKRAFQHTKIAKLEIPASLTSLHDATFRHTRSLHQVIVKGGDSFENQQPDERKFKQEMLLFTKGGAKLLFVPRNCTRPLAIGPRIAFVGAYAFEGCAFVETITFPPRNCAVTAFGAGAFTVRASVTRFGEGFLQGCAKLNKVTFDPTEVHYPLPPYAFAQTGLVEVVLPANVIALPTRAFAQTHSLKSLQFAPGSRLTTIERDVFWSSSIEALSIPDSVAVIEPSNFFGCERLATINVASGNKLYEWERDVLWGHERTQILFAKRTLEAFHIPATVEVIGTHAFGLCRKLRSVTFEDNSQLKSIGAYAFFGTALAVVSIPDAVERIADGGALRAGLAPG